MENGKILYLLNQKKALEESSFEILHFWYVIYKHPWLDFYARFRNCNCCNINFAVFIHVANLAGKSGHMVLEDTDSPNELIRFIYMSV